MRLVLLYAFAQAVHYVVWLRLMPEDMTIQLWDLNVGIERGLLRAAGENLTCVTLSPDARKVAKLAT